MVLLENDQIVGVYKTTESKEFPRGNTEEYENYL
jgi:hypothetical protein